MKIKIVDGCCPICHSHDIRSKVGDSNNIWWYICDNRDCLRKIVVDNKLVDMSAERFYFNLPGTYDRVYIEGAGAVYGRFLGNKWRKTSK